jgi:hypothetical protein
VYSPRFTVSCSFTGSKGTRKPHGARPHRCPRPAQRRNPRCGGLSEANPKLWFRGGRNGHQQVPAINMSTRGALQRLKMSELKPRANEMTQCPSLVRIHWTWFQRILSCARHLQLVSSGQKICSRRTFLTSESLRLDTNQRPPSSWDLSRRTTSLL